MKGFLFTLSILLLAACSDNKKAFLEKPSIEENNEEQTTLENEENMNVAQFFLQDETTAYFKGEGNEYASYTVNTKWLSKDYVALIEDNGGAAILKIYRIMNDSDEVNKLYEEVIEGHPDDVRFPIIEELKSYPQIEVLIKGPLEVGTTFDNWKIVDTGAILETPYQKFKNVIVIEQVADDFINRKYFVKNFGEVKRESIMNIDGEENYIVTSTLEKIEK